MTDTHCRDVESKMGMVPSFFMPIPGAPGVVEALWAFAQSSYLESAVPSPFKDRLFVYLSRFCEVRYCIVRHCAFLLTGETPNADARVADMVRLLTIAPPWERHAETTLAGLREQIESDGWPAPGTPAEELLIVAATSLFVEPGRSERTREALRDILGPARMEPLMLFLSFVRTAHYWTLVHPELAFEEDVRALLESNGTLAKLLLEDGEAGRLEMGGRLFDELIELRELNERRELEKAKLALETELREKDTLLAEVRAIEHELALKDERLQMALAASGVVGLWDWMVDTDLLHGDANFARLYGLDEARTAAGVTMEHYQRFVVADDVEPLRASIRAVFEHGADFLVEYRLALPEQPIRWIECRGQMVHDQSGAPLRFSGTAIDITYRKQAEQQKQFLMEELSHRVKNTFAMVQAIVSQSLRGADPSMSERLQKRLAALSGSHDVLLKSDWSATRIHELVETVLRLDVEEGRFEVEGPEMLVKPSAALSLSLLLHELATNASKHGALSVDEGKVRLDWSGADGVFRLRWQEAGGPPAAAPTRRGFGSRLIGMGICGSRDARLNYSERGFSGEFAAELQQVRSSLRSADERREQADKVNPRPKPEAALGSDLTVGVDRP